MRTAILLLAALLVPSAAPADPLAGSWKSDRELTLQRLEIDRVPEAHRRIILEEGDLGNAVVEFRGDQYIWTLGEQKRTLPYRIISVNGSQVELEYFRHRAQATPTRLRLFVTPELLYLPIREFNFYEVFRRVGPPASSAP